MRSFNIISIIKVTVNHHCWLEYCYLELRCFFNFIGDGNSWSLFACEFINQILKIVRLVMFRYLLAKSFIQLNKKPVHIKINSCRWKLIWFLQIYKYRTANIIYDTWGKNFVDFIFHLEIIFQDIWRG